MRLQSPFLTMAANTSVLITVVSLIALLAMTESVAEIRRIIILITTLPLLFTLRAISKENRSRIFLCSLLALLYFCGGVLALYASSDNGTDSLVAFIFTTAVTCWFLSSVMLVKALSLAEQAQQSE
jgi:uncharacterized membrane protein